MNIIKKMSKILSLTISFASLFNQIDKSFVYAMKPVTVSDIIKTDQINGIRRSFSVGSSKDFYDTESGISSCHIADVTTDDGRKVCFMAFNAPALMDGLSDIHKFDIRLKKSDNMSIKEHIEHNFGKYNIFQILGCLYIDSVEISNAIDEEYEQYQKESLRETIQMVDEKLKTNEYSDFIKESCKYFGDMVREEDIKNGIKSFMINNCIASSTKSKAAFGHIMFWLSELATAVCPLLLPITWFTSQKGAKMIAESEIENAISVENERAMNLEMVLKRFIDIVSNEPARIRDSNVLLISIDTRDHIGTYDGSWSGAFLKLVWPSAFSHVQNAGSDIQFRGIRNLDNAPKMVEYVRKNINGRETNIFNTYLDIFHQLGLANGDMSTLKIAGNRLRRLEYPERLLRVKEEKKEEGQSICSIQ